MANNLANTLSVSAIQEGTVIDHIQTGQAFNILRFLQLQDHPKQITVGLHLKSGSMGWKDLIKIEDWIPPQEELSHIALFAPYATVNFIHDYKVSHKSKVQIPSSIRALFACPNPRCITHHESVQTHFSVEEKGPRLLLRCLFCEKIFPQEEIHD